MHARKHENIGDDAVRIRPGNPHRGPYIMDVRKMFSIFYPLPLFRIW